MVFRSIKLTFRRFDKPFLGPAECVSCQKAGRTQHLTPGPNRYPTLWDQGSSLQLVKITFPFLSHQYFKWHQRVLLLLNKLAAWRCLGHRPLERLTRSSYADRVIRLSPVIVLPSAMFHGQVTTQASPSSLDLGSVIIMAHDPGAVVRILVSHLYRSILT